MAMIVNKDICKEIDRAFWDLVKRDVEREREVERQAKEPTPTPNADGEK